MGMEVVTTWTCDRCNAKQEVPLGDVAPGWNMVVELQVVVTEKHTMDMKLPSFDERKLCCESCMQSHRSWFDVLEHGEAVHVKKEQPKHQAETLSGAVQNRVGEIIQDNNDERARVSKNTPVDPSQNMDADDGSSTKN